MSVILTIGSALTRAEQDGSEVAVLVQGEWFRGHVRGLDGHGLMLDDGQGHDVLVRLEHVAVLRIDQEAEIRSPEVTGIPHPRIGETTELTV